jgi:hypothetical protein
MSSVYFNSAEVILPVCVGVATAATVAFTCCRRKKVSAPSNSRDPQILLIDTLAKKILENEGWWLFEGPFRTPGIKTNVDTAELCLTRVAPDQCEGVVSTLEVCHVFQTYEPTNVLQRFTRKLTESRKITGEEIVKLAPNLGLLLESIYARNDTTKITKDSLKMLFLGSKETEEAAIQAFQAKMATQHRLSESAPQIRRT